MIPGTLGIAETAILGSTIAWKIETDGHGPWRLTQHNEADAGYQITSGGENPRYWTAYRPGARDGKHELRAAAGEMGLALCIKACERHLQTSATTSPQRAPNNSASSNK